VEYFAAAARFSEKLQEAVRAGYDYVEIEGFEHLLLYAEYFWLGVGTIGDED